MFGLCAGSRFCLSAGLGEPTGDLGPVSQAPVDCLSFAGPGNRCPVQTSINGQLRTGTDKGNPTV